MNRSGEEMCRTCYDPRWEHLDFEGQCTGSYMIVGPSDNTDVDEVDCMCEAFVPSGVYDG